MGRWDLNRDLMADIRHIVLESTICRLRMNEVIELSRRVCNSGAKLFSTHYYTTLAIPVSHERPHCRPPMAEHAHSQRNRCLGGVGGGVCRLPAQFKPQFWLCDL